MKTNASSLFSSIIGPIFVMVGILGLFGFGIPSPYWFVTLLVGAALILFRYRRTMPAQHEDEPPDVSPRALAEKRHRFWIFVFVASVIYAASLFWLPVTTPEMRAYLCYTIMLISFGLCVGIFLYSMFTKKKP